MKLARVRGVKLARVRGAYAARLEEGGGRARLVQGPWVSRRVLLSRLRLDCACGASFEVHVGLQQPMSIPLHYPDQWGIRVCVAVAGPDCVPYMLALALTSRSRSHVADRLEICTIRHVP